MAGIQTLTIEAEDVTATEEFVKALGVAEQVAVRASDASTSGFRGFTISLVVAQPGTVDAFAEAALAAGGSTLKPVKKSFWGYGGVVQAPDGTIWKFASSSKQDTGPATREIEDLVLLLGVEDVKATKQFYVDRGLAVGKSFGSKYVEFETPGSEVKLALYPRKAAAKDAGVPMDGGGSHRLAIGSDAAYTDPDGFVWEDTHG